MVIGIIVALFLWNFSYLGVNIAIFEKREKKRSQKATKKGQKAAIKGCMIRGRHLSLHNKGRKQPEGCK